MNRDFFDGKITWCATGESVTLTKLTREQMHQVLTLIKASRIGVKSEFIALPQPQMPCGSNTPTLADRLSNIWRRVMVWMMGGV
jgi:hypothetical protein